MEGERSSIAVVVTSVLHSLNSCTIIVMIIICPLANADCRKHFLAASYLNQINHKSCITYV